MKPLDLLAEFNEFAGVIGFVATYEFDPQFFERRILAKKFFGSAQRIVVFMDRGRYQAMIDAGINVSGFNRRYLVVPIDRAPYVFHPKLYLLLGENRAAAIVGSSNCTGGGIGYNVELCSTFAIDDTTVSTEADQVFAIRQVFNAMKAFSADAGRLGKLIEDEFVKPAERLHSWLDPKIAMPDGQIELVHSQSTPLWGQLTTRLKDEKVRKITVISPFYDREVGLLKLVRKKWPDADMTVVAQPRYATLAGEKLAEIFTGKKHVLMTAVPEPGRRLHAKAFAFETGSGTVWLTGSPNATLAAFTGGNTESAILFKTKEGADYLLKHSALTLRRIDPRLFEGGDDDEPAASEQRSPIALHSAMLLDDGSVQCELIVPESASRLHLSIRNADEDLPVLTLPVDRKRENRIAITLSEIQMQLIRGTALCDVKVRMGSGENLASNEAVLVQVHHLLRQKQASVSGGGSLSKIEESGEDLVPYVESLGSIREAIEFFNSAGIRFFDGATPGGGLRAQLWKPRDPFRPDLPPGWINLPSGNSAADLRMAIIGFVERHQTERLLRHVRRGNLNGLSNFLDIFRTLNGLLFAYHSREMFASGPVLPFGFVTHHVMRNIELLIGPFERKEDSFEGSGFISSIYANFTGDKGVVRQRLQDERVPQMLCAAAETMIAARASARKLAGLDAWATSRLRWINDWISMQGHPAPKRPEIEDAASEYAAVKIAA